MRDLNSFITFTARTIACSLPFIDCVCDDTIYASRSRHGGHLRSLIFMMSDGPIGVVRSTPVRLKFIKLYCWLASGQVCLNFVQLILAADVIIREQTRNLS